MTLGAQGLGGAALGDKARETTAQLNIRVIQVNTALEESLGRILPGLIRVVARLLGHKSPG